jgi:hypothetical protein
VKSAYDRQHRHFQVQVLHLDRPNAANGPERPAGISLENGRDSCLAQDLPKSDFAALASLPFTSTKSKIFANLNTKGL